MLKSEIPILNATQIASAIDRADDILDIPEWGGAIKLRAWNLEQRDLVLSLASDTGRVDGKLDPAKFVRLVVLYGVEEPQLTEALIKDKAPAIIDRIANAVIKLNGIAKEAPLTASMTFRPESGSILPVSSGEGAGTDGVAVAG